MSSSQNREWSVSCGTAGSWSGTPGGFTNLNISVQKVPESKQVLDSQDNPGAHNSRWNMGGICKHLRRIWTHMRERKGG